MDCLFCKMAAGEIPVNKVYEDDTVPYVTLPSGWEHVLEDPNRLADDLALLARALRNLSDDLRRPAADHKKEGER